MSYHGGVTRALLVLLLLLPAAPAAAQVQFSVSPYVGVFLYDDGAIAFAQGEGEAEEAFKVDPARFLGVRLGVRFLRRLSIEGDLGLASLNGEIENVGDLEDAEFDGKLTLYSVSLGYALLRTETLDLTARLGIGGASTDFDLGDSESISDVVVKAGIGASYPIFKRVRLRGDVHGIVEFCDAPEEHEFGHCLEDASLTHVELDGGVRFDL